MFEYATTDSMFSYYVITSEKWTKEIIKNGLRRNPSIQDDAIEIVQSYRAYGLLTLLNPDILIAQAVLETGWFTSDLWRDKYNPAGIGITSATARGIDYKTIRNGIQAHVAHVCAYFFNETSCPSCELSWPDVRHFFHDDLEYIADFTSGQHKWATASEYPEKIVKIANEVAKEPY